MMKKNDIEPLFADLKSTEEAMTTESECPNCMKTGQTNILLTKIPFFREIMIVGFECPECGFRNNEVQFAGRLSDFGIQILFRAMNKADLNREVVKSEHSVIRFDEIDLEIPPNGKAEINTIEGLILRTYDELNFHQPLRRIHEPENYQKLQVFLKHAKLYLEGQKFPLTIKIRDPSGNSTIKNPLAPKQDKNMEIRHFERTKQELIAMGYSPQNAEAQRESVQTKKLCTKLNFTKSFEQSNFMTKQPIIFEVPCHACQMMGQMRMCQTSVPYFTDLVIMSFKCEYCGAHSAETKNSGEVLARASVLTLKVEQDIDLKRDLFKSETCAVNLPDIELELCMGTLGGVFTTVEGLIEKIQDHLDETNQFADSDTEFSGRMSALLQDLADMRDGKKRFTLILTDSLSHSFLSNPYHPDPDQRLTIEFRERTHQQNEQLGLNDMKTENYKVGETAQVPPS